MPPIEQLAERRPFQVAPAEPPAGYRSPPHNIEAEQALLGAILVNNDAFDRVSDFLRPEHFSEELHRRIFETGAQLIRAGKLVDVVAGTVLKDQSIVITGERISAVGPSASTAVPASATSSSS